MGLTSGFPFCKLIMLFVTVLVMFRNKVLYCNYTLHNSSRNLGNETIKMCTCMANSKPDSVIH